MDQIDGLLVDVNSAAPVVGNLEGHDYGVLGECRLFISGPDADVLATTLCPWLRRLNWESGFEVLKRYGNFADLEAPEQPMDP